jgi:hypothetical protein
MSTGFRERASGGLLAVVAIILVAVLGILAFAAVLLHSKVVSEYNAPHC